jgi:tetratricopeptide (TPR) repeat protein
MKDGEVYAGGKSLKIVSLTNTTVQVVLESSPGVKVPVDIGKVAKLCFGIASHNFEEGYSAYLGKDYETAVPALEAAANDQNPNNLWAFQWGGYYLGLCYFEMQDYARAGQAFDALLQRQPDSLFAGEIRKLRVKILANQGKADQALRILSDLLDDSGLPGRERYELWELKFELHKMAGQWREAERAIDKAIQASGALEDDERTKARQRLELARAEVALGRGTANDLASARRKAESALRDTRYATAAEREARAFAYVILGEVLIKETEALRSQPAEVRKMMTQAVEIFLKVVAVYGSDASIDSSILSRAYARTIELATTLGLRDVRGATGAKAAAYGFQ